MHLVGVFKGWYPVVLVKNCEVNTSRIFLAVMVVFYSNCYMLVV